MPSTASPVVRPKPAASENLLLSLAVNWIIPNMILVKLSPDDKMGPMTALLVGLAFPVGYFLYDLRKRSKASPVAILGFVGLLLTGGFGLMQLDGIWFAVKEAAIPLVIGAAVLISLKTKTPLVRSMLYNESVIDVARVEGELVARGHVTAFERLLVESSWMLAASFLLSAILNFVLAVVVLKSPPGTPEFTAELGTMSFLSYPVIVLPSMLIFVAALWRLMSGIKKLTGLDAEHIFKTHHAKQGSAP